MSDGNDHRSMLDSLISSAAADEPSEEQLRRLEARIAPLFVPGVGGGVAAAAKAGKSTLVKWLAGGLTVGALGAGGYAVHRSMQASPPAAVGVDAATPTLDALPDAPVAEAAATVTPAPTVDAPKQRAKSPPASSADGLAEEARILARAQTALRDGHPARALRDIDRHQAKFPRGDLAEERERLAIETLLALGRRDAAEARARHFRSAFPDSLQWDRIRALLDGSK